ncbi:hypothetical protein [Leifsonia shinshuensis]|uniref:Abi family protein n=1 Tax=Leifsonia shinshuensis TaxID=150026 RepID=A0A7G6YBB3_9MICO|nr:hypothetical protein [Leifsonia shinshuensis]QNE35778.1 Abi family protein [Leifsonia shinshuensis]
MDPHTIPAFAASLSEPRFRRYLNRYDGHHRLAIRLYAWNIEVSTAFWGPIGVLEIMLRNSIHDALRHGRSDDWWYDGVNLAQREASVLQATINRLFDRTGREPTPDQVVGASTFGFWVGLTGPGVSRDRRLSYETALWQPRLRHAFGNLGGVSRKELHAQLDGIRKFRNRIAHHEPIYTMNLTSMRDKIIQCAGYIDAEVSGYIAGSHRIDDALARQRDVLTSGSCVI